MWNQRPNPIITKMASPILNSFSLLMAAVLLLLPLFSYSGEYNGQDVTRPVTRFDIRAQAQTGAGNQNGNTTTLTLRTDSAIKFPSKWQIALRVDAPFESFRCPHPTCKNGCYPSSHMGDSLFQVFAITPDQDLWCFAAGMKIIFPTGGKNLEIGNGKFQLLPSLAFRRDLPEVSEGSYFGVIAREAWSIAGYSIATRISRTYLQPFLNINLPCGWFINSSPEMFYDWVNQSTFIPLDLMIGQMITPSIVVSLEYEYGLVYGYKNFRNQLEFRLGFFF